MGKETFFAPLIRGALIGKTNCPWIVRYLGDEKAPQGKAVNINTSGDGSGIVKETAAALGGECVPLTITVSCEGKEYRYAAECSGAKPDEILPGSSNAVRGKAALVTGGAQGFGEEISRYLVTCGAFVYVADLNIAGAKKLSDTLNGDNGKPVTFPVEVNVADEDAVKRMMETVALRTGGLDLVVSNAGILRAASILEQDIASFRMVTEINYTAFAIICKHAALLMKAQNQAADVKKSGWDAMWKTDIIQINSKSGLDGSNKNGSYAGGKFGGIGLVQSFAKELVEYGIKVNAICPGNFYSGPLWSDPVKGLFVQYLNTGKVPGAKTVEEVRAFYEAKSPIHRGCTGIDVIRAILYLVEQEYETGQAVPVTGGQIMLN